MARPSILGKYTQLNSSAAVQTLDISAVPVGGWFVVSYYTANEAIISSVEGATAFFTRAKTGTRGAYMVAGVRTEGQTSVTVTFDLALSIRFRVVYGGPAKPVSQWVVGLFSARSASDAALPGRVLGGDSYSSVAPSISVTENHLVLAYLYEATATEETAYTSLSHVEVYDTNVGNSGQTDTTITGYLATPINGATPDVTAVYPNVQTNNGGGVQIGIPGLDDDPEPPVGYPIRLSDGAGVVRILVNEVEHVPTKIRLVQPGFPDVQSMLETPGATWAHRGGSASYPEHSEYAYDQALLRGYGALEVSCHRSSDGWWFANHDHNFDHITGMTGTPNANTLTKTQIQTAYQNVLKPLPGYPTRPLYGLEEFLDKFGKDRVLILDPKNAMSFNQEFMALVDGIVSADQLVWKFYLGDLGSSNPSNNAAAAKARGWTTWGYFYSDNIASGAVTEHAPKPAWDLLGLSYSSPQSDWDTALSYGKPVVGHIAPTQAAYDTAISKGADMVQCSGVEVIEPVNYNWS